MVSGSVFRAITTRDMNRSDTARRNFAHTPIRADNVSEDIIIMKLNKINARQEGTQNEI